jgi:hypothetical protein
MVYWIALQNSFGTVESMVLVTLYIWLIIKLFSRKTTLWLKILTFLQLAYNVIALTLNIISVINDKQWLKWRLEDSAMYYFILLNIFYCTSQIMISFKYFDIVRQTENLGSLSSDEV